MAGVLQLNKFLSKCCFPSLFPHGWRVGVLQLKDYINQLTDELVSKGDLDGMLLTGQYCVYVGMGWGGEGAVHCVCMCWVGGLLVHTLCV